MNYSKEWRERMGYTQAQLAKACGVTLRTVQNWDMGSNVPASSLYKLEALETSGKVNGNCVAAAPNTQTNVNQQALDAFTAEIAALRRMFEDQLARKDDMIEKLITALSQK